MLNRDFTKSNKEYIKKNRVPLCVFVTFLIVGILVMSIFGLRGNFEMVGYNEFSVTVGSEASEYKEYIETIESVLKSEKVNYDTVSIFGDGDDTQIVVRYMNNIDASQQEYLNSRLSVELDIEPALISEHQHVGASVENLDYIYTALAVLLLYIVVSIFCYVRYNGASAVAVLIASALGTMSFLSLTAILRLSVGISYLAMLVILNVMILYMAIQLFESIRESSYLDANDYANAITDGVNKTKFRACMISSALLLVGVLFVLFAPSTLKYVALNTLFIPVVLLATAIYILPITWNMLITFSKRKKKEKKEKHDLDVEDTRNATIEG